MASIRVARYHAIEVNERACTVAARPGLGGSLMIIDLPLQLVGYEEIKLDGLSIAWSPIATFVRVDGPELFVGWANALGQTLFGPTSDTRSMTLSLGVSDSQLALLEDLRDGQALDVVLELRGIGSEGSPVFQRIVVPVDRDEWLERVLRPIKRHPNVVVEFPVTADGGFDDACHHLERAIAHRRSGRHQEAVRECRIAVENISTSNALPSHGGTTTLGATSGMAPRERAGFVLSAAQKFFHQAAHKGSAGREMDRHDSTFAISMVGGLIRIAQRYS